eukprot:GHVS01040337.1.p1 GENE.GHVS01040337.1~~GHVS01040337.1.p1  ORF type:complete len:140 (-),score=18.87 GHVS01040337.1:575-994(-)
MIENLDSVALMLPPPLLPPPCISSTPLAYVICPLHNNSKSLAPPLQRKRHKQQAVQSDTFSDSSSPTTTTTASRMLLMLPIKFPSYPLSRNRSRNSTYPAGNLCSRAPLTMTCLYTLLGNDSLSLVFWYVSTLTYVVLF